jgi:hypothetical protein
LKWREREEGRGRERERKRERDRRKGLRGVGGEDGGEGDKKHIFL